jgi:RimJ/RimL family protein N-acetyltransferase
MTSNDNFFPFIEGDRIYLREVRVSDVNENYYRWMNDPEITQYLESRFYPNSMETLQEYVKTRMGNPNEIFLAIVAKDSDKHIGNIKLGPINWTHRIGDIGIIIGEKEYWGKGYAKEAIQLMAKYAFDTLNLHKVTAGCYLPNEGAIKAFQNAGFDKEGVRKKHGYYKGKYIDSVLFGLIKEEMQDNE